MPWGMPAFISKGPLLKKIEDAMNTMDHGQLGALKGQLDAFNTYSFLQIVDNHNVASPGDPGYDHLEKHWLDPINGWWKDHQPIEPILREAGMRAIDLMLTGSKDPVPIAIYWVCMGHGVEVAVALSRLPGPGNPPNQVTMILSTPPPPGGGDISNMTVPEDIWLVREREKVGEQLERVRQNIADRHPVITTRLLRGQ